MMLLSDTIVDFHLFYDGAVDIQIWALLTRSQCKVSDTQVSVKAHGPLVISNQFFALDLTKVHDFIFNRIRCHFSFHYIYLHSLSIFLGCPNGWVTYNQNCYLVLSLQVTWGAASVRDRGISCFQYLQSKVYFNVISLTTYSYKNLIFLKWYSICFNIIFIISVKWLPILLKTQINQSIILSVKSLMTVHWIFFRVTVRPSVQN